MYHDDMYTELDLDNVARFFAWLGIVKPSCAPPLSLAAEAATAASEAVASEASEPGLAEEVEVWREALEDRDDQIGAPPPSRCQPSANILASVSY